jgi:bifunctional DNase/RNase
VVQVTVHSVRVSPLTQNRIVVLMEMEGQRYLPIWIGADVADAIALQLQGVEMARPLTHDLLRSVIEVLGAQIDRVLVNDIHDNTFFARIIFDVAGRYAEVDSRPSDAIALAVRVDCPIFVEESVLDEAALVLETSSSEGQQEGDLGIFRQFFDQMGREEPPRSPDEERGTEKV